MQGYSGYVQEGVSTGYGEQPPSPPAPAAPIDFSNVKGVYKNCRGIWAAQWTDEKGQRHTKYFNPKFFASEQTARVEAYKFKIAIQREIEAKGGVQRKRPHAMRARQSAAGRRPEYELFPTSGRRIRRSGNGLPYCGPYGLGPDFSNANPELLAMLQSVNVAGLSCDPAVAEPILSWQSGMVMSPVAHHLAVTRGMWQHRDSLYRTGECVDGAQLSERMLEGFDSYWHHYPAAVETQQWTYVMQAPSPQYVPSPQIFDQSSPMEMWWSTPAVTNAVLSSEPVRRSSNAVLDGAMMRIASEPPRPLDRIRPLKKCSLNEHPLRRIRKPSSHLAATTTTTMDETAPLLSASCYS